MKNLKKFLSVLFLSIFSINFGISAYILPSGENVNVRFSVKERKSNRDYVISLVADGQHEVFPGCGWIKPRINCPTSKEGKNMKIGSWLGKMPGISTNTVVSSIHSLDGVIVPYIYWEILNNKAQIIYNLRNITLGSGDNLALRDRLSDSIWNFYKEMYYIIIKILVMKNL